MERYLLGNIEQRFAEIVWNHEPLPISELIRICELELSWKRTTTYTVLKKMRDRGLFVNENGIVKALVSREEFLSLQSEDYIKRSFDGSLPGFLAAFTSRKKLDEKEILELQKIIDENRKR